MSTVPILFLRLEGVMQSWGERSQWHYRDTALMPTKSGIVGLIASAMGLRRGDPTIVKLSNTLLIAIRADRQGVFMTDYHTVTGIIRTANGGQRGKKDQNSTIISYRQYLYDASFLVGISGERSFLKECAEALGAPKWTIFLGRKSCVPSTPILVGISEEYSSLDDAMNRHPFSIRRDIIPVYEMDNLYEGYYRQDIPTCTPGRLYTSRRAMLQPVKMDFE